MPRITGYKYFLYSLAYEKDRNEIEAKIGKLFVSGTIIVDGVEKEYNMISDTATVKRYSDTRIIAEGDAETLKFTEPYTRAKRS